MEIEDEEVYSDLDFQTEEETKVATVRVRETTENSDYEDDYIEDEFEQFVEDNQAQKST